MAVENHIGGVVTNFCLGMGGHVIEELIDSFHCFLGGVGLLACYFTEGHQYCQIHCPAIIQKTSNNLLYSFLPFFIQRFTDIFGGQFLCCFSIFYRIREVGGILFAFGGGMGITYELFFDVTRHRNINITFFVIPLEFNSTIQVSTPIHFDCVCFFFDGLDEVIGMFFPYIFDSEIVYH